MKTRASLVTPASTFVVCLGAVLFVNASACGIESDGSAGPVGSGGRAGAGAKAGTGGVGGGEGGFAGTIGAGTGGTGGGSGEGGGGLAGKGGAAGIAGKGGSAGTGGGGASGKGGVGGSGGIAASGGVAGSAGTGGSAGSGGVSGNGGAAGGGGASGGGGVSGTGGTSGAGGEAGAGGVAGMGGTSGNGGGGAGGGGSGGASGAGAGGAGMGGGTGGTSAVCSALNLPTRATGGMTVSVPAANNPFDLGTALTLEAWVYPTGFDAIGTEILAHWTGEGGYSGYAFELAFSGEPRFVSGQGGPYEVVQGGTAVALGAWSHVAVTILSDGPRAKIAFWVNGKAAGGGELGAPKFAPSTGLVIGHLPEVDPGKKFLGYLDEARVSSSAEYTADFSNTLKSRLDVVAGSTVALYHFDSQTAGVVADSSGAGRDGKLVPTAELASVCAPGP